MSTKSVSPRNSKTKIVATIGPASSSEEQLAGLLAAGVDVFRLNMAHGNQAQQEERLKAIRCVSRKANQPVAVLADLAGPKMRLGEVPGGQAQLDQGQAVWIVRSDSAGIPAGSASEGTPQGTGEASGTHAAASGTRTAASGARADIPLALTTTYEPLIDEVQPGDRLMLADGLVSLTVERVVDGRAECRVVQPGLIRSRQGINLPGVKLSVKAMSDVDRDNARWAAAVGIDFVGLSFVRRADDVRELKELLRQAGSNAQVIAKIEKPEAVAALDEIIAAADGIMVARGDLGVEIDVAEVAVVQKRIVAACHRCHKPVIVATQMLESMQHSRLPTRAEVSDVANAVLDGTDACMLSGETAVGEFPREAVEMMQRIALAAEPLCRNQRRTLADACCLDPAHPITEATVYSAVGLAEQLDAKMIIVASSSGATALAMAKARSFVPVVGVSDNEATLRRMCLYWGILPLGGVPMDDNRKLVEAVLARAKERQAVQPGDRIVIVAGTGLSTTRHNMIVVHEVEER